ncbi:hypothetical protein WN51_00319 [Melipona quadrifasciata]|uniref:Uncharacterized protein n=1 Tax=Melipona quadrifasciata TaxID=166423 RepID=A0A0M9A1E3_9HYME|nr:hypothetical protein WN51_00319 [Melipona quadrifasciata]
MARLQQPQGKSIMCTLGLSWNVSPENLGHMAALSPKQETNNALDRGLMHGANFPEHVRNPGQRDRLRRPQQPFPADEVSHEDTIADRPRLRTGHDCGQATIADRTRLRTGHDRTSQRAISKAATPGRTTAQSRLGTAGAAPAAKRIRVNSRRSTPIVDRATHVQCQTQFVRHAGVTVREYEEIARNPPRVQQAPRSPEGYIHPARPTARVEPVDALGERDREPRPSRVSRQLQLEGATSERKRADPDAGRAARPRSPQDFGRRESEQPLQQLVPQPRPTDRDLIQDNVPENVHVVIRENPLFSDIDYAHHAIDSNIIKRTMISHEARERDDAGGILATSNSKCENGDVDYDYSHLAPETDVGAIDDVTTIPVKNLSYAFYKNDDETEACNDEDQQLDKLSNVLDRRHIKERNTPSYLSTYPENEKNASQKVNRSLKARYNFDFDMLTLYKLTMFWNTEKAFNPAIEKVKKLSNN